MTPLPADPFTGIPSGDRHVISTGLGEALGDWTIDAMYTFVMLVDERRIEARPEEGIVNGSNIENATIHEFGAPLTYTF